MEDRSNMLIDVLTPFRELAYVYPLLVLNWVNWVIALAFEPPFFEPSRFDFVLALTYSAAILMGLVRRFRGQVA